MFPVTSTLNFSQRSTLSDLLGGRPGPFYHKNDVNVFLGKQKRAEGGGVKLKDHLSHMHSLYWTRSGNGFPFAMSLSKTRTPGPSPPPLYSQPGGHKGPGKRTRSNTQQHLHMLPTYKHLLTAIPEGSGSDSIGHQCKKSFLYLSKTRYAQLYIQWAILPQVEINPHSGVTQIECPLNWFKNVLPLWWY